MSIIRPEQRGHAKFLRRGRSTRAVQYVILVVAVVAAGAGVWAVFSTIAL